jgi:hypothetical protein
MPTVPGLVPDQAPSLQGTPEVGIATPVEAFGGAVAHAISGLGGAVEQASDKVWQRAVEFQDLKNRSEVDKADAAYMEKAGILHAQFSALQGDAATQAFPKYIQDLKDERERIGGALSNPMTQKMYDSQTLSTMGRTIFNGAGHAGQQAKVAALDAINQRQTVAAGLAANSDDPATRQAYRDKVLALEAEKARQTGTMSALPERQFIINSSLDANVIQHQAEKDPIAAADALETKRASMTEDDYNRTLAKVRTFRNAIGSTNLAEDIYNAGVKDNEQTLSLKDMQDMARTRAQKEFPDDAEYAKHAVDAVDHRWRQGVTAEQQQRWSDKQTIAGAQLAGASTLQQLLADPQAKAAYESLPPKDRKALTFTMNNQANDQNFTRLWGMAKSNDDATRTQFMDMDLNKEPLSESARRRLISEKDRILKNPGEDPRVWRAMSWLRGANGAQLESLGVYRRNPKSSEDFDSFVGTLDQALEDWQSQHGKPASQEDVTKKIAPLIMQSQTNKTWFGLGPAAEETKLIEPPDTFRKSAIADRVNHGDPEPTDAQIRRDYVRMMLKEKYGRSAKPSGE